jgi:squalene-hopene/tetraprenyl-beta-curcumene cyclase
MAAARTNKCWICTAALCLVAAVNSARADEPPGWHRERAAKYLDDREKSWFAFSSAGRGEGAQKSSCISCHTVLPYLLARPALRRLEGSAQPTQYERALIDQTRRRVEHWSELDTAKFRLLYDFNRQKKKESWGTEAVLNAVILTTADRYQQRDQPSEAALRALSNLWQVQVTEGDDKGSWEWLDFGSEPWESHQARYFGACLAALAVGTGHGYGGRDEQAARKIESLKGYLRGQFPAQHLYNRIWVLWASTGLDRLLQKQERMAILDALFEKQHHDGGWSLSSLGSFSRKDDTPQATASDGYATGLVSHVLQSAGIKRTDPRLTKGLDWLRSHQAETGEWRAVSLNKERNPADHAGKFMSDAATAYAILALAH